MIQFPAGLEYFTSLAHSPYPDGRVVRSPRAGKSKGMQNEYFKLKKFDYLMLMLHH
jgi:hypothetical protein